MPEIANVVSGTTIASVWGNQIRDRAVMRYASAAARTASIPSPTEGDLSYLNDTNTVYVYNGSAWVPTSVGGVHVVDDGNTLVGNLSTTPNTVIASMTFTPPSDWATYALFVSATVEVNRFDLTATLQNAFPELWINTISKNFASVQIPGSTAGNTDSHNIPLFGVATGLSGAVPVQVLGHKSGGNMSATIYLAALGFRTS